MRAEDAIATLRAQADPTRAAEMRAYHKQTREVLGLSNALTGELAEIWRKSLDQPSLVLLAKGLWASDIFEARICAGKLFVQARLRPEDTAAWACIAGLVPDFDSWAIADAVAMGGQKRLQQDPARLTEVEGWIAAPHMWTRRAALVFTLPFTKSRHPSATEADARTRVLGWCETLAPDRDWFIQKAIAWWLRELSKRDPDRVTGWLATHGATLKPFALKEASKHLDR
ncbi:DNA alkylation repair protein [Roseicyclus mahoneyensis]|uniref:3-methyladenine DNA glycosylase AlkD n=1 Tax=Roseicyclus mahoneyensis TaxID=164332 RepID=A0A316GMT0_9RHOB|nr:DNA alkylation repair protein [Roseicyclus mahoneyensis]PWK60732.1 3-methyladenine DNA glycosylase AlkD [Roseicyclus mahoneyensis]